MDAGVIRCAGCLHSPKGRLRTATYAKYKPYCSAFCRDLALAGAENPHRMLHPPKKRVQDRLTDR